MDLGNHEFGYAWDRNLTDADSKGEHPPYIELMAGVYTDNQPDFAYLQPGATKSWSQYWYPIRSIGTVQQVNLEAAVSLKIANGNACIGVAVTTARPGLPAIIRSLKSMLGAATDRRRSNTLTAPSALTPTTCAPAI